MEVELVSHEDKNNWWVFEIEMDEDTPMSRVSKAADMVLRLPTIPRKVYSLFPKLIATTTHFCIERKKQLALHRIKYVTNPSSENKGTKLVGYS